ncbi:MAG: rod shape-determining protein MreC [Candidatus Pacebacteria bacterium]|nr:rod shape-determining protein MreC [Candidatus Paceibacterota bacterium]
MKFTSSKRKILIIIIGLLLIFSLNFFQKEVKGFFYFISSPIQKTLWRTGNRVSDFFELITEIKNLKRENGELKLKNQELISQIAQLIELKKENEVLKEALGIGLEKEFKLALAEVVSKDISQDSILINKGSKDGITENCPVITQQKTLVGKIDEVYENFSRVILIFNKESSFDAKISDPENDISGVVNGKGNLQLFLDFVPQEKEIKEGDFIVTTSLGGIFPKGLLVGQIAKILRSDIEPFQQAKIRPAFDIRELETVFIITDF